MALGWMIISQKNEEGNYQNNSIFAVLTENMQHAGFEKIDMQYKQNTGILVWKYLQNAYMQMVPLFSG